MRTIKTSTGASITLDGDLLAILETLYREITVKRNFERSFEDMIQEIQLLIEQMTEERAASVSGRKPVPEQREIRKRPRRGSYAKINKEIDVLIPNPPSLIPDGLSIPGRPCL